MKTSLLIVLLFVSSWASAQQFDFYGPQSFDEILDNAFNQAWSPTAISSIENRKYVVILDEATQTNALMLDQSDNSVLNFTGVENVHGATSTYGSVLRSVFQLVDINTHFDNDETALEGKYVINPMLHSYYAINAATDNSATCTDADTFYIGEEANTGYVLVEFDATASSTRIKASSQWEYSAATGDMVEVSGWTTKWLKINGTSLSWTTTEGEASSFYLADATGLIDLTIEAGADFNPLSETYQTNATAELPEINAIEDSKLLVELEMKVDPDYVDQLGTSTSAADAASAMLDEIETTLTGKGASLRYPKTFYLALRESMLSQTIASTDIYGARLGYNTIPHVYFTNASDDSGVPHPFMVIGSHAVSTRPNQLLDVSRPPGAEAGVGYGESTVTRHGKLGEFLLKIPLKDYGLIENLQDNDLTAYGDLATDFDNMHGTTTTKDVYNYASVASIGVAIDGVTIYPGYNNNLRFAVEDAEVTHSGIHVGAGLELHYHADGHGFNGNGINLYNLADYAGHDHPPVIGMAHDGIALFGKYESGFSSMTGYDIALDEYGGHDHGDGFGYHYHAHAANVESSGSPGTFFDEHFLLVGAWKGLINDIPGFDEGKLSQFADESIARYVGASYDSGDPTSGSTNVETCESYEWEGTTYTESGTYTVTLTSSTGADSTATLNLTILKSTAGSQDLEICGSYKWEGTTYTSSGTYTATLINSAGCDSTATLNLTITDTATPGAEDVEVCGSYDWEGTTYTESGTYMVTLTSSGGCDSTATLNLTILEASAPTVTESDGVLFVQEQKGATYQWYDCDKDEPIGNQTHPQFTPMASGSFAVSVSNGACISMSECVTVEAVILGAKPTDGLEIYPNPTTTGFRVRGINEPAQVTVMTVSGKILSKHVYTSSETEIPIPGLSGVYLIKVEFGDKTLLKKVIKAH